MGDRKKGSEELRAAMPYGTVREMSEVFGSGEGWVAQVVSGKKQGNPLIVECAERIAVAYEDSEFEDKKTTILQDYGNTN